jgi:ankyrin repeat protein
MARNDDDTNETKVHAYAANGDIAGLRMEFTKNASPDVRDEDGRTPLMVAVESPAADLQTIQFLIDNGADVNALTSPKEKGRVRSVLGIAVQAASLEKSKLLVESGANVNDVDPSGYSILLTALYGSFAKGRRDDAVKLLDFLVASGASLDVVSKHGESVLSVASHHGEFRLVNFFLDHGADSEPLGWSPLFFAIARNNLHDVKKLLDDDATLDERDYWERTPFLLSVHAGHQNIAELLLERGSDRSATGRCGQTAIMYAISRNDGSMLKWLISQGWDIEQSDEFGSFPLIQAANQGSLEIVQLLLAAGARPDRRNRYDENPISQADSPEIVELLARAGENLSDVRPAMRSRVTGSSTSGEAQFTKNDFRRHKGRTFGMQNPEWMNNPFWDAMVRSRECAYAAAARFEATTSPREPVWCFDRFGQSMTRLPDGRYVEIAGEHEDWYDEDFCIYNDVVVHNGDGTFDIFGYPEQVFPPTDFHSATYHAPYIYIIGNLGYREQRQPGITPIFRVHCGTWAIERVHSRGENPGWIHDHKATLVAESQILISGGKVVAEVDQDLVDNSIGYVLNLNTFTWRQDMPAN